MGDAKHGKGVNIPLGLWEEKKAHTRSKEAADKLAKD